MLALQSSAKLSSAVKSAWPHLDEKQVTSRLEALRRNANLVDQGALGLCGEATFYHHIIQRDPLGFFAMGYVLFLDGACVAGKLLIDPDSDLLEADYGAIVTERGSTFPPIPPQADWMLLAALRDSQNEILDYEGRPEEHAADGSNYDERWEWYDECGLYKNVTLHSELDLAGIKANVIKSPTSHVSMSIQSAMIQAGTGRHVISLESPLVIDEVNNSVTFQYWTWGRNFFNTANLTVQQFTQNFVAAIVAKF